MYVYQTICVWIDNINKGRRQIGGKKGHEKGNFNHFIWKWNKNKAKQSENTLRAMDFTLWEQKNIQPKVGLLVLSNTIRFCSIVDFTLLK